MSGEFSRRVDVRIIKDEPETIEEFLESLGIDRNANLAASLKLQIDRDYQHYLDHHQPYRWRAVAANNEPIAHGESYFHESDCLNAVTLLFADDTTMYWAREYGDDRGDHLLRYGATDRKAQGSSGV